MKNTNKKGFTIVELVVVIAVIAILAAVLIPTVSGLVKKANETKDVEVVKYLNTALAAYVNEAVKGTETTVADAVAAAKEFGYDLAKLNAKAEGNEILWDSINRVFCYFDGAEIKYVPEAPEKKDANGADYWVIDDAVNAKYSTYLYGNQTSAVAKAGLNLDVTGCYGAVTVNFNEAGKVDIYTDANDTLVINNDGAEVNHYGEAKLVDVKAVKDESYHLFGKVVTLKVTKGRVVSEAGSKVQVLAVLGNDAVVEAPKATAKIDNVVISAEVTKVETVTAVKKAVEAVVAEVTENVAVENIDKMVEEITTFAGGKGTAEDPYLIETAEHLKNIGSQYTLGYKWYKVADGVSTIDCSGWPSIKLNGSFDGNGVTLANLSYALFNAAGVAGKSDDIVIKNFTAYMNSSSALVRNIYNCGTTTFENVTLYGTVEGDYNVGSFYNYGTANAPDFDGASYTVEFKNAKSYLTLICTTGNSIGGMLGHGYQGDGNVLSVNMDSNSGYFGKMYTTGTATCYQVMAMCSAQDYVLNGETISRYINTCSSTKLASVAPVKGDDGFTVAKQEGAASYKVSVHAQVSGYAEDGYTKLPNAAGITLVLSAVEVKDLDAKVLANVTYVEIVNEYLKGEYGYTIEGGVLKAYVGDRNALSGNFNLQVTQYDANGNILATGMFKLGEIAEPVAPTPAE